MRAIYYTNHKYWNIQLYNETLQINSKVNCTLYHSNIKVTLSRERGYLVNWPTQVSNIFCSQQQHQINTVNSRILYTSSTTLHLCRFGKQKHEQIFKQTDLRLPADGWVWKLYPRLARKRVVLIFSCHRILPVLSWQQSTPIS